MSQLRIPAPPVKAAAVAERGPLTRPRPHGLLRAVAIAATATTFALIAVGALVRATGSGEGCPGWPRCFGRWVPPFTYHPGVTLTHALIEYSHRLTASIVFVLVFALAVVAWRRYRNVRRVLWPATAAAFLWLFQAVLGGLVVKYGLTAWLVTAHLATAMLFVGALVATSVAAFSVDVAIAGPADALTKLARAGAAAVFLLIVVGGLVRGEGAGLAFRDWPLMNGRVVPSLGALRPALQFAHRALAVVVAAHLVVVAVRAWRVRRTRTPVAALSVTAVALVAVQVVVGAFTVWSKLAPAAVVAHVTVAALLWASALAASLASRPCAAREASVLATDGQGAG